MSEYLNNAYFWQKIDTLVLSGELDITRKKGERHPDFRNMIYPTDYGHLTDTKSTSGQGVSVYVGSGSKFSISALIVAADILQKDLDVKILLGCNEDETEEVLRFLNQTDFQKTVLIKRGNEIPSWGITDN